ncbi:MULTISPECIES: hypothetical protein [unclassified Dyella]|uniref:hypothetical protein n=1 Tax=unclassified Dyella TaxID=2634549 RepID=UPI003F8E5E03
MPVSIQLKRLKSALRRHVLPEAERQLLATGKLLSDSVRAKKNIQRLEDVEFRIFSQWGDDGIIQWLTAHLNFPSKTFVEFGVENYRESNTRFLMMNNNWSGLIMDGGKQNIEEIIGSEYYWRYDLTAKEAFIDRENINELLRSSRLPTDIGLLHIDLDGNDYWILNEIDAVVPTLLILEYNSVFGLDRAITVPYDKSFQRSRAHSSNLYFGASLRALHQLASAKGYAFVGCNSAGNNAYFVKRDALNATVCEIPLEQGFVLSKFRESRAPDGALTYLSGADRLLAIKGLPVFNTDTGQLEKL